MLKESRSQPQDNEILNNLQNEPFRELRLQGNQVTQKSKDRKATHGTDEMEALVCSRQMTTDTSKKISLEILTNYKKLSVS